MIWSNLIRQTHRWVSFIFTTIVIANIIAAVMLEKPPDWMIYAPLPFLFVLLLTGFYMFIQPYVNKRSRHRK